MDGKAEDGFERHYAFWHVVCREWPTLSKAIASKLLEYLGAPGKSLPVLRSDEVIVTSISIPNASLEEAVWEISLNLKSDDLRHYRVTMKGRCPQEISGDC